MKIAVTGPNGHVGVNLCRTLLEQGHEVRVLTHRNTDGLKSLNVVQIKGDLLDISSLQQFIQDVDIVFHLAAKISISGDQDGLVRKTNSQGTRNLLDAALSNGIRRFIHFSSIHAFNQVPLNTSLDESRSLVDHGFAYDMSKAEGERSVMEYVRKGLDAVVICPTAIIGPEDPQPSLTGKAVLQLYNGQIPALVPGGYNWVDVRDVVKAATNAMERGRTGEKYLVSGQWHSVKELSAIIMKVTGRKTVHTVLPFWVAGLGLPFIHLYSRITGYMPLYTRESLDIIEHGHRNIDHSKATQELDHQPRSLMVTVSDLIDWFGRKGYLH